MCAGDGLVDTVEFEKYASWTHLKDIVLRIALSATHAYLRRLGGHRTIRENADPKLACFSSGTREHLARRLYLIARHPCVRESLQSEGAERKRDASSLGAIQTLLAFALCLPLAMFYFFRKQHTKLLAASRGFWHPNARFLVLVHITPEDPHLDADNTVW